MRLIVALALLFASSVGLHAQERANPTGPVPEAAAAVTQPHLADSPPAAATAAEPSVAASRADAARAAPIFDREFVRHVAAMVIAGVLVAVILRAIF